MKLVWVFVVVFVGMVCGQAPVTHFVERDGNQLKLNGKPWVYSGCNMYWLGLDENCEPGLNQSCLHYPSLYRIDDAIQTAKGLGFSVIRAHTLGISTGFMSNGLALHPNRTTFNDQALNTIDYAIHKAGKAGIRLIIPLTDNWNYFHGSYRNFVDWRGYSCKTTQVPAAGSDCIRFYTDQEIMNDFKAYLQHLLLHVNAYSGTTLAHDPAILAWETGNELAEKGPVFSNWTNDIARFIKKDLGAAQLVMDGRQEWNYGVGPEALAAPYVDMYTDHYYMSWDRAIDLMRKDAQKVRRANKVFVVGEYGPGKYTVKEVAPFLRAVENAADHDGNPLVAGDTWWSFFGHGTEYGFVEHGDGFTIHYPGKDEQHHAMINALRNHAHRKRGVPIPSKLPRPTTPSITFATAHGTSSCPRVRLTWRGAAMACNYTIQRSPQRWRATTPFSARRSSTLLPPGQQYATLVPPISARLGGTTRPAPTSLLMLLRPLRTIALRVFLAMDNKARSLPPYRPSGPPCKHNDKGKTKDQTRKKKRNERVNAWNRMKGKTERRKAGARGGGQCNAQGLSGNERAVNNRCTQRKKERNSKPHRWYTWTDKTTGVNFLKNKGRGGEGIVN